MPGTVDYRRIYELLDTADPVPYDCGMDCGAVCCSSEAFDGDSEPYIYLLPGEMEYLRSEGCALKIKRKPSKDHCLPKSFGKYVYVAYCSSPAQCDRRLRPIQCRSFPLTPHMTEDGELHIIYYDETLPYTCPLIQKKTGLSEAFISVTHEAWKLLSEDKAIKDLILMDSEKRWGSETLSFLDL